MSSVWTKVTTKQRSRENMEERTFHFNQQQLRHIRAGCVPDKIASLANGRWKTNDPKRRQNTVHTLDLGRAGEIAAYSLLKVVLALDPETAHWKVGAPSFERRAGHSHDRGDLPIDTGSQTLWVEVKTTTNRKGAHTREHINAVARDMGYTFQRLIWDKRKHRMKLTPTFNKRSKYYKNATSRLLVGCIGTYTKGGGCSITVSKSTFLLPVAQCKWEELLISDSGEEGLKRVHKDMRCI